ncbi:MAG: XdhC/CoxI family protein [Acidimicrobiales bacterium]
MIPELAAAIERGESVVLATVVQSRRSVPRRPGAKMLIYSDGRILGTIGGGEMEHRVKLDAAEVLLDGKPRLSNYSLVDPSEGDPGVCGGEVDIYLEPYMPQTPLYVIGAGHVGHAVSDLAQWLGFKTMVWDDRSEVLETVVEAEHADVAMSGAIANAIEQHPVSADASIVVVTRNVALDLEILPHLLATPARYIGLMGSLRRWEKTRTGLAKMGIGDDDLDRVQAPIGVEIHAETPAEIAVSIMAAVIGNRRGT